MNSYKPPKVYNVIPNLYWGGEGVGADALLDKEIRLVVNMGWYDPEFKERLLDASNNPPVFLHFPIYDSEDPTVLNWGKVYFAVSMVVEALESDTPVYVHCQAGQNRSALVVGLVLKRLKYFQKEGIVAQLQQLNPKALNNSLFKKLVNEAK